MPLRARDFLGSFHFLGNSVSWEIWFSSQKEQAIQKVI